MKWITHEAVAIGSAFLLGMPLPALAGVAIGSVLPDMIDQGVARALFFRKLAFRKIHRGATHWFGWWMAALVIGLAQPDQSRLTSFLTGAAYGSLVHVVLDLLTVGGVPLVPWSRRPMLSFGLCKTGSIREYVFLAAVVVVFFLVAWDDLALVAAEAKRMAWYMRFLYGFM